MKKGPEYSGSLEKRAIDVAFGAALLPVGSVLGLATRVALAGGPPSFTQERIGRHGFPFDVNKLVTLNHAGQPMNALAAFLRKTGLDESKQAWQIVHGDMSLVGWRPLLAEEYEEFRDNVSPALGARHDKLVLPTKPGILSSFSVAFHEEGEAVNTFDIRAEMNIRDVVEGSVTYDLALIGQLLGSVAANRQL